MALIGESMALVRFDAMAPVQAVRWPQLGETRGRDPRRRSDPLERTAISSECGRGVTPGVTPASCRAGPGTPNDGRGKAQRAGRCAATGGVGSRPGRHESIAPGCCRRSGTPSGSPRPSFAAVPDIPPRDLRLTAAARWTELPPSGARSCPSLIPEPTGRLPAGVAGPVEAVAEERMSCLPLRHLRFGSIVVAHLLQRFG